MVLGERVIRRLLRGAPMDQKVAVLGAGSMGRALLRGMLKAKWTRPEDVVATTRQPEKAADLAKDLKIEAHTDNRKAASSADIVILGVKPQILPSILQEIRPAASGKLVVSIAAGVTTASIEDALPGAFVVRTMPNLPVHVDAGATAMCR